MNNFFKDYYLCFLYPPRILINIRDIELAPSRVVIISVILRRNVMIDE